MTILLTKKELEAGARIKRRMLNYILNGERNPSKKLCERLAIITGINKEAWMWPHDPWFNPYIKKLEK